MKKQINDLLLKMQTGENCIGETANKLLDLYRTDEQSRLFEEVVEAFKDTHNLYVEAVKDKYMSHDITRLMGNESVFRQLEIRE